VIFASGMRSTVNFFAEVLSWIFFVDLFTEMIGTAIVIVFTIDWFTGVVDTGFGVSAVIVTFAVNWVTGVLLAFVWFVFVVAKMWSLVSVFRIVITVESVFTFDLDTSFLFTLHTSSTMFVTMASSVGFSSDVIQKFDDTFVFETVTTVFECWIFTVFVCFAFFGDAFSLFTLACSRFTFFAWSREFIFAVLYVSALKVFTFVLFAKTIRTAMFLITAFDFFTFVDALFTVTSVWSTWKAVAVCVITALDILTCERTLLTDLLLSAMIVGLAINWFANILLTSLFFAAVIVACTINWSTDFVQVQWMGFTDVSSFVITADHKWSNLFTVESVFADMLFCDIFEGGFEFGIS